MEKKAVETLANHILDKRPWGEFKQFTLNESTTVKVITVLPGKRLSLQTHKQREEYWYFLDNPAKVTINDTTFEVSKGDSVHIPLGAVHRVEGMDKEARFLEIAFGTFDENDIERIEDDFDRPTPT